MDPDPGGPKTCGSCGSGSPTLVGTVFVHLHSPYRRDRWRPRRWCRRRCPAVPPRTPRHPRRRDPRRRRHRHHRRRHPRRYRPPRLRRCCPPARPLEEFSGLNMSEIKSVNVKISVADPDPDFLPILYPGFRSHADESMLKSVVRIRIRCLFDPWIRDPEWVKNQNPDPGWTTHIIFPRA